MTEPGKRLLRGSDRFRIDRVVERGSELRQRRASMGDLGPLQEIERRAGGAFRTVGMDVIADDEPIGAAEFGSFLATDGAWVSVDDHDRPVAYLLIERLGDAAHIEQVTVDPDRSRQGLGAALIGQADSWAAERGLGMITLTTFRDVAWNAPYYARLGFTVVDPDEMGLQLRGKVDDEAAAGLARWPRVAMRRAVRP